MKAIILLLTVKQLYNPPVRSHFADRYGLFAYFCLQRQNKGRPLNRAGQQFQIIKKSFVVLIHIGFWACYFIVIRIVLGVYARSILTERDQYSRVLNTFINIILFAFFPSIISFYFFYFLLFPKYLFNKRKSFSPYCMAYSFLRMQPL